MRDSVKLMRCAFTISSLVVELTLHCQMCDPHFKFGEDQTKTAVVIEDDRYFGQTNRQTHSQMILYLSSTMHCIGQTTTMERTNFLKNGGQDYKLLRLCPCAASCRFYNASQPHGLRSRPMNTGVK